MNSPRPPPTTLVGDDSSPGWPYEKYGLMTAMTGTSSPSWVLDGSQYERWTFAELGPPSHTPVVSTSMFASWTSSA